MSGWPGTPSRQPAAVVEQRRGGQLAGQRKRDNRFGLLRKGLPTATTKMLTQQLRELEADGLISRTIFAEMPPRVEYALTAQANSLLDVLAGLYRWGEELKRQAIAAAEQPGHGSPAPKVEKRAA